MQFLTTTPLALALFGAMCLLGPIRGLWALTMCFPLGAAAAVVMPGVGSVGLFDFVALAVWLRVIAAPNGLSRTLAALRLGEPGFPLLLLIVWMALGSVFLPRILAGVTEVFVTVRFEGGAQNLLLPLQPVGSNINQLLRTAWAASMFVAFATLCSGLGGQAHVRRAMIAATLLHISLAIINLGSIALGMPDLLDVIRTANMMMLDNQMLSGLSRISAGFPEPSSFAYYTIGLYGYWLRDWFGANRTRFSGLFLAAIILLLLRSTSTSAYLGFAIVTLLFLSWHVASVVQRTRAFLLYYMTLVGVPLLVGVFVLAWNFVPAVSGVVDQVLVNKLSSRSGEERMSWNAQALVNFSDSWGLGVGVGSVRASSWIVSCLGSLGLVGVVLYLWFIVAVLIKGRGLRQRTAETECAAAMQTGAFAIVAQACMSKPYPNLEMPFFTMCGIAAGLLLHAERRNRSRRSQVVFTRADGTVNITRDDAPARA